MKFHTEEVAQISYTHLHTDEAGHLCKKNCLMPATNSQSTHKDQLSEFEKCNALPSKMWHPITSSIIGIFPSGT